jgi:FK506-binding protein 6
VIEGLDLAVGSMKAKEKSEFIICPELAWGDKGCPPRIPANAYVYFKIDLLEWVDSSAAEAFGKLPIQMRKKLPFPQVLDAAKSEKRKGTAQFEKQNFHAVCRQ